MKIWINNVGRGLHCRVNVLRLAENCKWSRGGGGSGSGGEWCEGVKE